jgi:glycosyltransferase involved in cell wall biosynthesis
MTVPGDRSTVALMIESDGPGGAERMLLQLAGELRRRGHTVVPVGPAVGCGWLAAECRARGFEPEGFTLRFPFDPGCVASLLKIFRRRGVRVVHSHEFTMAVFGAAAARMLGLPHVITMHGGLGFAERWRRRVAFRWAARRGRATVAVSRAGAAALATRLRLSPEALIVIPNGIRPEPPSGADIRGELGLTPGTLLLIAIGNLYAVKGHDVLLRALAEGGDALPPWHLAIAGRGEEQGRLRALGAELGLGDRLSLLGYRADVADLLGAADVFVMPSRSEGLPLALLEAMFAARPIVVSAVGGIPEVVRNGEEALLVPPGDVQALAEVLGRLLPDADLRRRLGERARATAEASHGVEAMADAYERLYDGTSEGEAGHSSV